MNSRTMTPNGDGEQQARIVPPWARVARGKRRTANVMHAHPQTRVELHVEGMNATGAAEFQRALVRSISSSGSALTGTTLTSDSHSDGRIYELPDEATHSEEGMVSDRKEARRYILDAALGFLGNLPGPIGVAAKTVLAIVGEIQATEDFSSDWEELGRRYDRITSMLKAFPGDASEEGEKLITILASQLMQLAADLESHSIHTGQVRLIGSVLVKLRSFMDHAAAKECLEKHKAWLAQILIEAGIPAFASHLPSGKGYTNGGFQVSQNSLKDVKEAFTRIKLSSSTNAVIKKNTIESTDKAFTDITFNDTAGNFPPERLLTAFLVMLMSALYVGMAY